MCEVCCINFDYWWIFQKESNESGLASVPDIAISSLDIMAKPPVGLNNPDVLRREKAIGFFQALRIPVWQKLVQLFSINF